MNPLDSTQLTEIQDAELTTHHNAPPPVLLVALRHFCLLQQQPAKDPFLLQVVNMVRDKPSSHPSSLVENGPMGRP